MTTKRIGLVLQGGGALGAYECGVIKALYDHDPAFHVDVVSGVSIGAINAAVLVGAKHSPVQTLEQMWREHFASRDWPLLPREMQPYLSTMWGTPGMCRMRPDFLMAPLMATSIYETSLLRRTLSELIDLECLNRSSTHLVVTAVDIATGELTCFENRNRRVPFSLEMILASGSLAPNFPMTRATDQRTSKQGWYWDGGFSSNLPLSQVINLLEQCDEGDRHVQREVIVVELFPMRAQVPTTLLEVHNRLTQLLFSSKLKLDHQLFDKIDGYLDLMQQIEKELPAESELRQHPAYKHLMSHRKIKYTVITSSRPEALTGASNFSQATIEERIEAGYQDAFAQLDDRCLEKLDGARSPSSPVVKW